MDETPVVEADIPISNVSVDDASEPAFQQALIEAVADRLDVDESQVHRALFIRLSPNSLPPSPTPPSIG